MGQIIEGRWDCSSCGKKLIPGRYNHCPGCGKGRSADVKFYVADPNDVVAADVPEKGPDWMCEYCQAYAPDSAKYCPNCGAPRSGKTYHEIQQEKAAETAEQQAQTRSVQQPGRKRWSFIFLIIAALAVFLLVKQMSPRSAAAKIVDKAWEREITIESYRWVDDADWELPSGAVLKESRSEIRSYDEVLDHYETRSREVPEEYVSGYSTEYRDMGNGYFESYQVPQYSTRYRTEYYDEAVYRKEPVYDTRYYYQIERWTYDRTLSASGGDSEPYWPEVTLASENERENGRHEQYTVRCEDKKESYTADVPLEKWQTFRVGDQVKLTISSSGHVQEITKAQ